MRCCDLLLREIMHIIKIQIKHIPKLFILVIKEGETAMRARLMEEEGKEEGGGNEGGGYEKGGKEEGLYELGG